MRFRNSFAVVICLAVLLMGGEAHADQRVALVIGNGAYVNVPQLPNPPNDASDIAASLERLNFRVTHLTNANFDEMRRGMIDFGRKAFGSDMAVVYYAGHGIEVGGENWLIPTDAELRRDTDVENEAIGLRSVILQVASAKKVGLVILDACRNNPFSNGMQRTIRTRAVDRGLNRVEPSDNVLVAYAAKDGTTANDGGGRNSPFTAALLKNLEAPGVEIRFMFASVRDDVLAATNHQQQPFVYGSLSKDSIYLRQGQPIAPVAPAIDEIGWEFLKDTTDVSALKRFIEQFPNSSHRAEADARIEVLGAQTLSSPGRPVAGKEVPGNREPRPAKRPTRCVIFNGESVCD